MKEYSEDEYLQLAGIQHYTFCQRQWALIHIEQIWEENVRTMEGSIVHEKAHDERQLEKRGDSVITRGLEVNSSTLGIYGICDIVEFHKDEKGVSLLNLEGTWMPIPVEYKRGKPKMHDADRLQLCAQAICLESMFHVTIEQAYLYYDEIKHREGILLDVELRKKVREVTESMHAMHRRKITPHVKTGEFCYACSIYNQCMPQLNGVKNVHDYIRLE